jgi:uncharacterized protein (UPF0332 family)
MTENSDIELNTRFVEQFLKLWINPEIERRQKVGDLPENFTLHSAQVIMNFDAPTEVRLNEEIKVVLVGAFSEPVENGKQVSVNALENIKDILLTEDDPNAGYFTMILHRGNWFAGFDFRYNAAIASEHLEAARQFLDSASSSLEKGDFRVVADNLFSAVELMAKGLLLMHDKTVLTSKKHGIIHSRYNQWGYLGNTAELYTQLLNKLTSLRGSARYLHKDFNLPEEEAKKMIETAEDMYRDLEARIPKRYERPL